MSLIGIPKKDMGITNSDYVNITLTDYTSEELSKDLKVWTKDTSYFKHYSKVGVMKAGDVLVRMYRFEKQSEFLLSHNGEKIVQTKILPICKVILSRSDDLAPGDIVFPPENIALITTNPTWLEWKKIMENSRPIPEGLPEPDKQIGVILEWRKLYQFSLDKIDPTEDDRYTFLLPSSLFRAYEKP